MYIQLISWFATDKEGGKRTLLDLLCTPSNIEQLKLVLIPSIVRH